MKPTKSCPGCGRTLFLEEFPDATNTPDMKSKYCQICTIHGISHSVTSINTTPSIKKTMKHDIFQINSIDHKFCSACQSYHPLTEFNKNKSTPSGHSYICKKATKKYNSSTQPNPQPSHIPFKDNSGRLVKYCSYHKTYHPVTEFTATDRYKSGYYYYCKEGAREKAQNNTKNTETKSSVNKISPKPQTGDCVSTPKQSIFSRLTSKITAIFT